MKIQKVALEYDKGTIGPAVNEITGKNFQGFLNAAVDWRAKFMRAVDELEKANPQEGTMDRKRLIWAKNISNALNSCITASFGDSARNLYKL